MKILKTTLTFLLIMLVFTGMACGKKTEQGNHIIPQPVSYIQGKSSFSIDSKTEFQIPSTSKELAKLTDLINERFKAFGLPALKINIQAGENPVKNTILLLVGQYGKEIGEEGYLLDVNKDNITIKANTNKGIFYGVQTLFQLLPAIPEQPTNQKTTALKVASCKITDYPRFAYRGMHLDVGRHFFPVDFIKKYIDIMAMFKMNTFHWHLTEDQGWRLEIKKYPLLTEISAWRKSTTIGRNNGEDNLFYGGFYTQEEARDVVAYAAARQVEVIPEIELPGHTVAVLAAYPELSCTGGPHEVWTRWGVNDDIFCAGNEKVFDFLEDVLTEVMDIFPSKYIHIGGDEAPKTRWENCEKCQQRIKDEGLKNEHELQSYFIKRVEKFVNQHGKQIIGWDEILEGGLAPGATVMSWRGIEGGIEAARTGHDAIMTPLSHCYLNFYQANPADEPLAIGGYVTLKDVYSFEPVPAELTEEESKYILGAQGNLWTEYIKTSDHAEYMAYPRAIALAEVGWSPKESRNWDDFSRRFIETMNILDYKKLNYSKSAFEVSFKMKTAEKPGGLMVELSSIFPKTDIYYYSTSAKGETKEIKYTRPFWVDHTQTIHAFVRFKGGKPLKLSKREININDAFGKVPMLNTLYDHRYDANGAVSLTDGLRGDANTLIKDWIGYSGVDADMVLDLGEIKQINNVSMGFLNNPGNWIFLPTSIEITLSEDGVTYFPSEGMQPDMIMPSDPSSVIYSVVRMNQKARYIRLVAKSIGVCPEGHWGAGNPAWLFVDEIMVNSYIE